MKKVKVSFFVLVLSMVCTVSAWAEEDASSGVHTHDGFFLRLMPGMAYGSSVEKDLMGSDFEFSGNGPMFLLQVGGAISNNLILFGEIGSFGIDDPDIEWGGQSGTIDDASLSVSTVGVGVSYYFMPINAYVSGSLSICRVNLEIDGDSYYSERGPGVTLSVGKEWWVSDNWGLGVALVYHHSQMEVDEGAAYGGMHDFVNDYFGVAFSATYN